MTNEMHGGLVVADVLTHYDITHIFTLCGGHISPILIGCDNRDIKVLDTRSEVNAVFAADAYARLSGKVGIAVVTAGPGVTNSITALKNAQLAESSIILIGGATATMLEGRGALQDIEQLDLLKSATKWQTSIRKVNEIVSKLNEAFYQAKSGVPGPVFVEMPVDILYPEAVVREWYGQKNWKGTNFIGKIISWYINRHVEQIFKGDIGRIVSKPIQIPTHNQSDITLVLEKLSSAKRPVILAGSQLVSDPDLIPAVVNAINQLSIPIFLSGMSRGLMGQHNNLHYKHKRTATLKQSDFILLLGTPTDFRLDYGRKLPGNAIAISVNLSRETLKMNRSIRKLDHTIHTHPAKFIIDLAKYSDLNSQYQDWHETIKEMNKNRLEEITKLKEEKMHKINPLVICQAIEEKLDDTSIIVADGGDFVATLSYIVNPRNPLQWLDPGPFGTLGVGAGFAIGAKTIYKDSTIWLIYGDGALGFSIAEFDTFVRHNIPVIAVVGNDASWQQITREQVEMFDTAIGTELQSTAYHQVVEGFGAKGLHITSTEQIDQVLTKALQLHDEGHAVLINVELGTSDFRKGSISM